MDVNQIEVLQKALKALMEQTRNSNPGLFDKMEDVHRRLKNWKGGMPVPDENLLREWGVFDLAARSVASGRQGQTGSLTTPGQPAVEDSRGVLDMARELANQGKYYIAVLQLTQLARYASGDLAYRVQADLVQYRQNLAQQTRRLVESAQRQEADAPRAFDRHEEAWNAVLESNPELAEAKNALERVRQKRQQQREQNRLGELRDRMKAAASNINLPGLNDLLGELAAMQFGEAQRPDAEKLKNELRETRGQVRQQLGVVSTLIVEGNLRGAYRKAREYLDRRTPVLIDESGLLGSPGQEVSTASYFIKVSEDYLTQLRKKLGERLSTARAAKLAAPDQALKDLDEALAWLNDEMLTLDHRTMLGAERQMLDAERQQVVQLQTRYEAARQFVVQARSAAGLTAQRKLGLLIEAQERYPDYPNLIDLIDQTRQDRARELAGEVETTLLDARRRATQDRYSEALQLLQDKRQQVLIEVPAPLLGSRLEKNLTYLQQYWDVLTKMEGAFSRMEGAVTSIEQQLDAYAEHGNTASLKAVNATLGQIPTSFANRPRLLEIKSRLSALQTDEENFTAGQAEYRLEHWEAACVHLDRVSNFHPNYSSADVQSRRARAAKAVLAAAEAEKIQDWERVRENTQRAEGLFNPIGPDEPVDLLYRQLQELRQRLDHLEENDQPIRQQLAELMRVLTNAKNVAQARQNAAQRNRVESIPQFKTCVEGLDALAKVPSTCGQSIQEMLIEARDGWRAAYLDGMQAAYNSQSLEILRLACLQSADLMKAGLLYDETDLALERKLRQQFLDAEYRQLKAAEERDWSFIEKNRRERLGISDVGESTDIQRQLEESTRLRIEAEVNRRGRDRTQAALQDTQEYLRSEVERWSDPALLQRLIQLYWETQSWQSAEQAAHLFSRSPQDGNGIEKTQIWQGLTRAAQYISVDQVDDAKAILFTLESTYYSEGDLLAHERQRMLQKTLDRLIREARTARDSNTNKGRQEAMQKCILASQINPLNADPESAGEPNFEVAALLRNLGQEIRQELDQLFDRDGDLKLSHFELNLPSAIQAASSLVTDLTRIDRVSGLIGLDEDEQQGVKYALRRARETRDRWRTFQKNLEAVDQGLLHALNQPEPMSEDGFHGGWNFEAVGLALRSAFMSAGQDTELRRLVQNRQELLDYYDNTGRDLFDTLIRPLIQAIHMESFDEVVQKGDELNRKWTGLLNQNKGWTGLETLLAFRYLGTPQVTDRLLDHVGMARRQRENLTLWNRWAEDLQRAYNPINDFREELDVPSLDDLIHRLPLKTIIEKCQVSLRYITTFLDKAARKPQSNPLSRKAAEQRDRFSEGVIEELQGEDALRTRLMMMMEQAIQRNQDLQTNQMVRLRNDFHTFRSFVQARGRTIPEARIQVVERALQECEKIDPCNPEIKRFRDELNNK